MFTVEFPELFLVSYYTTYQFSLRNVTNEHLAEIFSIYGSVASAEIEKDGRVGLSKGSAYVTFKRSKDMNQAMLHLDGAQLDGNVIKATFVLVANKRRREPSSGTQNQH